MFPLKKRVSADRSEERKRRRSETENVKAQRNQLLKIEPLGNYKEYTAKHLKQFCASQPELYDEEDPIKRTAAFAKLGQLYKAEKDRWKKEQAIIQRIKEELKSLSPVEDAIDFIKRRKSELMMEINQPPSQESEDHSEDNPVLLEELGN